MKTPAISPFAIYCIYAWISLWKGLALWHSAKHRQRNWFIAMLVLYPFTYGIVEIAYLFYFAKPKFSYKLLLFWQKNGENTEK